jgi:hypothetical protein
MHTYVFVPCWNIILLTSLSTWTILPINNWMDYIEKSTLVKDCKNVSVCSASKTFDQREVFIVSYQLWYGTPVFRSHPQDCLIHSRLSLSVDLFWPAPSAWKWEDDDAPGEFFYCCFFFLILWNVITNRFVGFFFSKSPQNTYFRISLNQHGKISNFSISFVVMQAFQK